MEERLKAVAFGLWAESRALHLLQMQGWVLLHQRWCCRYGEIDLLLCKHSDDAVRLLAVEVKGRRCCGPDCWGQAAFNSQKRRRLARALNCWLAFNPDYGGCHLEVVLALVPMRPVDGAVRWLRVLNLDSSG